MTKATLTRTAILEYAARLAGESGLDSLTIGSLAAGLGMSKSGLFAHFGSRENLQLAVLAGAESEFRRVVLAPVLKHGAGAARWKCLCERLLVWAADGETGCLFLDAGFEFSGRPGVVRDAVVRVHRRLRDFLEGVAREAGLKDTGVISFQVMGIILSLHQSQRLLGNQQARRLAAAALRRVAAG